MKLRICVCTLAVAVLLSIPAMAAPVSNPPNIILFLADDLGYGDLGCYNPETDIKAPVLDGLAKNGIRFTDHYAAATICSPSRRAFPNLRPPGYGPDEMVFPKSRYFNKL